MPSVFVHSRLLTPGCWIRDSSRGLPVVVSGAFRAQAYSQRYLKVSTVTTPYVTVLYTVQYVYRVHYVSVIEKYFLNRDFLENCKACDALELCDRKGFVENGSVIR